MTAKLTFCVSCLLGGYRVHWKSLNVFVGSDYIENRFSRTIEAQVTGRVQTHVWWNDFLGDVTKIFKSFINIVWVDWVGVVSWQLNQVGNSQRPSLRQEFSTQGLFHLMISQSKILFNRSEVGVVASLSLVRRSPVINSPQLHRHRLPTWLCRNLATLRRLEPSFNISWNL